MNDTELYQRIRDYLLPNIPKEEVKVPGRVDSLVTALLPCLEERNNNEPVYGELNLMPFHTTTRLRLRVAICSFFLDKGRGRFFSLSDNGTDNFLFSGAQKMLTHLTDSSNKELLILELEGLAGFHYEMHALLDQLRVNCTEVRSLDGQLHRVEKRVILILLD